MFKRLRIVAIVLVFAMALTVMSPFANVMAANEYETKIAAAEAELTTAQNKLSDLKKTAANAKTTYENTKPTNQEASLVGFLMDTKYGMGWTDALKWLEQYRKESKVDVDYMEDCAAYTNIGVDGDATSLDGLIRSLDFFEEGNELRIKEGASELKVSAKCMLMAAIGANYLKAKIDHAYSGYIGNNIASAYEDPFDGWYTAEKPNKEGHYQTLISDRYKYGGFAMIVGKYNGEYYTAGNHFCHSFSNSKDKGLDEDSTSSVIMDVATVKAKAQNYINYINNYGATEKAAYEKAQAAVTAQETVVAEKQAALTALKPTSVSLSSSSLSINVGSSSSLTATVKPSTANSSVTWSSSNTAVATVSNGTVKGVKAGTATITATTANGKTATCKVTVSPASSGPSDSGSSGTKAVYRMYNPNTNEHLYTTDANEYETLCKMHGWGKEGVGWYAPSSGTAVYRLYQPGLDNHLYTTDKNEISVLTKKYGWIPDNNEQPVFYSGGSVSVYRVYNKASNGLHHLTTDYNEYKTLPKYGWKQENVAMKAVSLGNPFTKTQYYK